MLRAVLALGLVVGGALVLGGTAHADVVHTHDGRRLEGKIVSESKKEIVIETRLGRVTVAQKDVSSVERGKTPRQEFDERFAASKDDVPALHELATWAEEVKLRTESRKCYRRILELAPDDEPANLALGNVLYKGEWMTPKERDVRRAKDEDVERRAQGLVEHEGRWVTPEDKARIEAGLVQFEGKWMTLAEAKARQGLAELDGEWLAIPLVEATQRVRETCRAAEVPALDAALGDTVVAGPWPKEFLQEIAVGIQRGRALFDTQFADVPPGVALFGGKAAEFYAWERDSQPYLATIAPLSARTTTVGDAWRNAVERVHGWVFWDPSPVSSVRAMVRPESHVSGHCYYHYGHVLLNRHRYDGRLLPPWFGEGYASLLEWWIHGRNTVVFKADGAAAPSGTVAASKPPPFGRATLTRGDWQIELKRAFDERDSRLVPFDTLARKSPGELNPVEVAMSMGIVLWLLEGSAELEGVSAGALDRFHAELKRSAPKPPHQVLSAVGDRVARYDTAFRAAVGLDSRTADRAWREWFRARTPVGGAGEER